MNLADAISPYLPYLRRYGRALAGNQTRGDAYVRATLEAIIAAPDSFPQDVTPKVGLYRIFHRIWSSTNVGNEPVATGATGLERLTQDRLKQLSTHGRQALLLSAMEGFKISEVAQILGIDDARVSDLLADAIAEMDAQTPAHVLIIEDEPIISMDLEQIVKSLGHQITDIAITRAEASASAQRRRPNLILADIQLADGSSGIDAVHDILSAFTVPVIFITAFPERLLTGERPEPVFLITKPFHRGAVKAAISQALFLSEPDLVKMP